MFEFLKTQLNKWGVFWGIVYGLVALGFYFTPGAIFLLGLASASTAAALQTILFRQFRWHFALLGALLTFESIFIYLKRMGVHRLTMAEITPHRMYIGTLVAAFVVTYTTLFFLVAILLRTL